MKHASNTLSGKSEKLSKKQQKAGVVSDAPVACHLVLVLYANELAAWQASPEGKIKALPVKGELRLSVRNAEALERAHADIAERLRGNGIRVDCTHWLVDGGGRQWCPDSIGKVSNATIWQLLAWEWLVDRFGLHNAAPWEAEETFTNQILPWLITADDNRQRQQLQSVREREHHNETERLAIERTALVQENDRLRSQNTALQQVDVERLVSFLPALFPRVFTVLGPTDLALLCGQVMPLSVPIPSPYPEPSEEALRTLQRRFHALPHELQKQIVGFVKTLPQRQKLQPRPEMRELVQSLEGL